MSIDLLLKILPTTATETFINNLEKAQAVLSPDQQVQLLHECIGHDYNELHYAYRFKQSPNAAQALFKFWELLTEKDNPLQKLSHLKSYLDRSDLVFDIKKTISREWDNIASLALASQSS